MRYDKRGRKRVTLLRNFGKWGYWNKISKKWIIPITPSMKALIEELWFDLVDELAVLLSRKATNEEIRITGIKPNAAH